MNNIAIIPARCGSKGLKDKNIKLLCGKPLISYTIEAAIQSKMFSTIMVSTDSIEYAEITKRYGAQVPFLRNPTNASDSATTWSVVREVLEYYNGIGQQYDTFALLQPTSPLRSFKNIQEAYGLFHQKDADAVVSVCEMEHSPLWCNTLSDDLCMNRFISQTSYKGRQQLHTYYRINGAIYISNIKEFEKNEFLYRENCYAYIMSQEESIDIDTINDFMFAELLLNSVKDE